MDSSKPFVPLEHYSHAKYIFELTKLCQKFQIPYKIIGQVQFDKIGLTYPIYRIVVNPSAHKNFCLVAGVQAYEIAGPLTILRLIKERKKYLSNSLRYIIYPLFTPSSFDLRQRNNDKNRDVNGLDKAVLASSNFPEVQVFYKDIKNLSFEVFLSLHEDVDEKRFYAYVFEKKGSADISKNYKGGC